jgi:hypothetical protein
VQLGTQSIPQTLAPLLDRVPEHVPRELWRKAVADTQVMLTHLVRAGTLSQEQMELLREKLEQQAWAATPETAVPTLIEIWTYIESRAKPLLRDTQYPQLLTPALAARPLHDKKPPSVDAPIWRAAVNQLFELLTRVAASGQLSSGKLDALSAKILKRASRADRQTSAHTLAAIWSEAGAYLQESAVPPRVDLRESGESAHPGQAAPSSRNGCP